MSTIVGAREALLDAQRDARTLLASLGAEIGSLTEARQDANSDDEHDPEGATLAWERSQADALRRDADARIAAIDRALQRIIDSGYGDCLLCGSPIAAGRLAARPWAEDCIDCASGRRRA